MSMTDFDPPERFVAGSVGEPGERVFFLQATGGNRVMTVSLEKQQVMLLGERLGALLDEVAEEDSSELAADAVIDNAPLDTPIEDEFRVASLSLAWDAGRRVVIIEARERSEDEDDDADPDGEGAEGAGPDEPLLPGQVMRVVLDPAHARAFTRRCAGAVAGGRPSCPFCGQPLNPTGHICPRANGYRR